MANQPKRSTKYPWIQSKAKPVKQEFSRVHDERYNSTRWRKLRAAYIALHPICEVEGCGNLSRVCDHITPVVDGGDFWYGPFQALCHPCHNSKSAAERHARRKSMR